ncbi:hypothetical protein ABTA52_18690, partial [Acinetobacter baumannii]
MTLRRSLLTEASLAVVILALVAWLGVLSPPGTYFRHFRVAIQRSMTTPLNSQSISASRRSLMVGLALLPA